MASRKKTVRKSKARGRLSVPPDERPFEISFTSSENTADKRKRRFFIALQIALNALSADEMDKIEPVLRDSIGRSMTKVCASSMGYEL